MRVWTKRLVSISGLLLLGGLAGLADDNEGPRFGARLTGFQEVPPILTDGKGTLTLTPNASGTSLAYTLTYSGMATAAGAAHIHFGQAGVAGNVVAFLCGGGGKPACPAAGGTVTGTIMAADILSVPAQGVTAGDFAGFLRILRSGDAYANVHTAAHAGGEIRGQISRGED